MRNQRGQTLIIIVMAMFLALGVGITVASRFFSTLHSEVESDAQYRSVAVAEAAIESILLLDRDTLNGYVLAGNCGSACTLQITGADGVVADATVTLSYLGDTSDPVLATVPVDNVIEVNMDTYDDDTPFSVCWDDPDNNYPSVVGLLVYGDLGSYQADSYATNTSGTPNSTNGFNTSVAASGFSHCFAVTGRGNPRILRLRALYSQTDVFIVPNPGSTVPSQGIQVTSVGTVLDTIKTVTVVVSDTFLPMDFDYTLFSISTTDPLTNAPEIT